MVLAGLDPARVPLAARNKDDFSAYLELHIEQGPCLEQQRLALGVVEAINGARRLNCRFTGEAGHAGTVPMAHRKDALAASAEWMVMIESTTLQHGGNLVATVGELRCLPGAVNVIPGEVALSLDIRGPQDAPLDVLLNILMFTLIFLGGEQLGMHLGRDTAGTPAWMPSGWWLLGAGLVVGYVYLRRQWHKAAPLFPVDLMRIPVFRLSMCGSVSAFCAQMLSYLALPFLLLEARGLSPMEAGMLITAWPLATVLTAPVAGL